MKASSSGIFRVFFVIFDLIASRKHALLETSSVTILSIRQTHNYNNAIGALQHFLPFRLQNASAPHVSQLLATHGRESACLKYSNM